MAEIGKPVREITYEPLEEPTPVAPSEPSEPVAPGPDERLARPAPVPARAS